MKKSIVLFLLFCLIFLSSSCMPDQTYWPHNNPDNIWVSKVPDIYFTSKRAFEDENWDLLGEIKIDDEYVGICVSFHGYTENVTFYINDGSGYDKSKELFGAVCKSYKDKLIMKINKKRDYIFDGQYDTITFIKESLEEQESD